MHLTLRYRVKDKHARGLNRMARSVNFVWNYCADAQKHAVRWRSLWPSAYTLMKFTAGSYRELGVSSDTISSVCKQYVRARGAVRKRPVRYRGKRTLGWVPFKGDNLYRIGDAFRFYGKVYSVWNSRPVPEGAKICDGSSFSQDSRGRWYLNIVLSIPDPAVREPERRVGIDLGLKTLAALSTGETVEAPKFYRASEARLATAQRARKTKAARRVHAKIAARRKDFLHKLSARLVREFDFIAVGDVNASGLAKTKMAKSVNDAGWSSLRQMLRYKSIASGGKYVEVNEAFSTQTCSNCGVIGGPKGRKGLVIRKWGCGDCGSVHDRDTNAARNILRAGLGTLIEEPARLAA